MTMSYKWAELPPLSRSGRCSACRVQVKERSSLTADSKRYSSDRCKCKLKPKGMIHTLDSEAETR